jgi:GTP-binding protein
MKDLKVHGDSVRLIFEGPTRGLLGYKNQFVLDTKGEGILSSRFTSFQDYAGEITKRQVGSMISMASGKSLGFSLWNLQERGVLFIGPQTMIYEGMIIGESAKDQDLAVNVTRGKKLTNTRSSGADEAITLVPVKPMTLEQALEYIADDELVEVTPLNIRLRKKLLTENERKRGKKNE